LAEDARKPLERIMPVEEFFQGGKRLSGVTKVATFFGPRGT
jgi:hypothetical protein